MALRLDIMSKFRLSWAFLVLREGMKLYFASEGMKKIFHQQIDRFRHGPDAKIVIMGGTYDAKYFKLWVYIPYILMRLVIQDAIFTQNIQFMSPKSVIRVLIWGSSLEFIINKVLKVHRLRLNLRPNDRIKAITPVFTCRYKIKLPKINFSSEKTFFKSFLAVQERHQARCNFETLLKLTKICISNPQLINETSKFLFIPYL